MLTKDKLSNCNMKGFMNQKNKAEEINIEKKILTNKDINYKIHSQERLDSASNLELAIDSQNRNNKMSNNINNNSNSSYVPTAANSPTSYSSSLTSIPDDRGDVYEVLESVPNDGRIMDHDLHLLNKAIHPEPFSILGYQKFGEDSEYEYYVVRAWIRNAKNVKIKALDNSFSSIGLDNTPVEMENRYINGNNTWLFEKAFRTLKDRIPTARTHFCGYDSNNYNKNDLKENLQGENIRTRTNQEQSENNNNNGDNNPPYTQKKGKLTFENTTCSTDVACNYYIHDNLDSNNCLRKLYYEYLVEYINDNSGKEYKIRDTYSFGLLLSDDDIKLFQSGSCWHVDNIFGSHIIEYNGVKGVRFTVWAPNAKFVRVVGDWNSWDGRANPMRLRYGVGIWELFIPHLGPGEKYGYEIHSNLNDIFVKIDPYSQEYEIPPKYASIISSCDDSYKNKDDRFKWEDEDWMKRRKEMGIKGELRRQPISIYEVHLPSWMRKENGDYLSYREIAKRLVDHVKNLNFTYVEFLPLAQHPFEGSWGYQVTGQYAPYSRLGTPDDFKYLINELHKANIGVFMDFVPAHFCKDSWGLVYYDGTPTYEYGDPREGEHKQWGTAVFNFRRNEVRSFLLGAAYHWLRRYHIDGLRIDAVSSMLYRNYLRPNGEWIPNEFGGDANLEAVSLLQELNWVIHKEFPGVFTMAEESTAWQGVTKKDGGLGFDAKWDLGWMNDTLSYLYTPPDKKSSKHNKLTFRGLYMSHESWVLPLSHDEVVNGKGSLLDKCGFTGAPYMDRIRTLKALFGYQIGIPGRPLLFQGAEIAQGREWKENRSVDWHEGEEDIRKKVCIFLSDLLGIYRSNLSLHAGDDESWNFQWVDCENSQDCIIAFLRKYKEWYNDIVVICNFSSRRYQNYPIGVPHGKEWKVLINSDDWKYGGSMFGPGNNSTVTASHGGRVGWDYCLWVDIPEFSCMYFKPNYIVPEVNNDQTKKEGN